jgi:hypothetical protein
MLRFFDKVIDSLSFKLVKTCQWRVSGFKTS